MTIEMITDEITGPGAWMGPELQDNESWMLHLNADDIAEIDAALAAAKEAGVSVPFAAADFPLTSFTQKIDEIIDRVSDGKGICLVRGLPRDRYSDEDCEIIYWGIGVHIGRPVSQNARGHVLGHVRDEGRVLSDPNARPYQTHAKMDFHCDLLPVDVLGLFCMSPAKSGGESYVVSAQTLHNVIREERPDYLEAMYQPFNIDWHGEEPAGSQPWYSMPMFSVRDGKITSRITSRRFVHSVTRHSEDLSASPMQLEAIDFAQEIARRPELRLRMMFEAGDMQFLSNHTTLHGRSEFEDYDEPERQRHLLRMWIALDEAKRRPLASLLDERYSWVEKGGIPQKQAA